MWVLKIIPIFANKKDYARNISVFWFFVFSFFFYSREHEPPHVHVEGASGFAVFDWNGEKFVLREKHNIKNNDLSRIAFVIDENADIILKRWQTYFGKEVEDENY